MHDTILSFGVFTDCHYAYRTVTDDRFYPQALDKLQQCLQQLQTAGASFLLNLGDTVDTVQSTSAVWERLLEARSLWENYPGQIYHLLGNHDVLELTKQEIAQGLGGLYPGWKSSIHKSYYAFTRGGIRFFCLDSCFDRSGRSYEAEEYDCREAYLDTDQLYWLEKSLGSMEEKRAVVCCHTNLDHRPAEDGSEDPHVLKNADQVRAILEQSGKRIVVLQGHYHPGEFTVQNGIAYITFRGMTLGNFPENNAFALVQISSQAIAVRGYGQQQNFHASF